jgi:putative hydrolase of the HAD superfamily
LYLTIDGLSKEDLTNSSTIDSFMLSSIDTIIFDLGEVIVDLHTHKTIDAFASLFQNPDFNLYNFHHQVSFFNEFEKGLISETTFRQHIRNSVQIQNISDEDIDTAWNAMLGDTPQKKLDILSELKKTHKILALSNTNSIHIKFINNYLSNRKTGDCLENYFHFAYYSHHLFARKPDKEIYQKLIALENINPSKTLFIDDRIENIKTAQELGMQTFHMTHPEQFYDLF